MGKLNGWVVQTDVGCFDDVVVSFGCVIRDLTSNIFLAATKLRVSILDPTNAEMLAIRWSLQVAKNLKLTSFMVKSDALAIVDNINGIVFNANLDSIVGDCKTLISDFSSVSIMFISRTSNVVAHQLFGIDKSLGSKT
ncbi:hypothetical protein RYX36_012667 [Vicia faba]